MHPPLYLAGDIGGTKSNLALFSLADGGLTKLGEQSYSTGAADGPFAMLAQFLKDSGAHSISAACLGFAGPVRGRVVQGTNFPWTLDADRLAADLGIKRFDIINDLVALAAAIPFLDDRQLQNINPGELTEGNIGVLAVGTGLGEAHLVRHQGFFAPCPSEGGHKDFAARNEPEIRLHRFLTQLYGRVSVERILSGRGLLDLYRFFRAEHQSPEPIWLSESLAKGDAGPVTRTALDGTDPISALAIVAFTDILGAEAGNVALQCFATGGIYLGGGVLPKLGHLFDGNRFFRSFTDKGRMASLLAATPVNLITDPSAALLGAAAWAAGFFEGQGRKQ